MTTATGSESGKPTVDSSESSDRHSPGIAATAAERGGRSRTHTSACSAGRPTGCAASIPFPTPGSRALLDLIRTPGRRAVGAGAGDWYSEGERQMDRSWSGEGVSEFPCKWSWSRFTEKEVPRPRMMTERRSFWTACRRDGGQRSWWEREGFWKSWASGGRRWRFKEKCPRGWGMSGTPRKVPTRAIREMTGARSG